MEAPSSDEQASERPLDAGRPASTPSGPARDALHLAKRNLLLLAGAKPRRRFVVVPICSLIVIKQPERRHHEPTSAHSKGDQRYTDRQGQQSDSRCGRGYVALVRV